MPSVWGEDGDGFGVYGESTLLDLPQDPNPPPLRDALPRRFLHCGVQGYSGRGDCGVKGESVAGDGVHGESVYHAGVRGTPQTNTFATP
jgi:hypothetical protein